MLTIAKSEGVAERADWGGPLYDPDLQKDKKKLKLSDIKAKFPPKPLPKNPVPKEQDVTEGVEQINEINPMLVRDGLQVVIDFLSQYPQATALTAGAAAGAAGTAIVAKLVKNAWRNHKELEQLKQDVINWSIQKLHANKNVSAKGGKVAKIIQTEIERRKQGVAEGVEELDESDLILNPASISKAVRGFVPHSSDRTDHEVEMAKSDLYQAGKNAVKIYELIKDMSEEQGLEGWVQEKIVKAADYLNTVAEYLEGKELESMDGVGEGTHLFLEGISQADLADVLCHRLERRHPDIYNQYDYNTVYNAVDDVASFHAGAEELGSSDINIMLRRVIENLKASEIREGENKQVKGGDPCWSGYEMVGMKSKNGKKVPNCVPAKGKK
jgi:hypothetical protein